MRLSKTRIDRSGRALARNEYRSDDEYLEADDVLDQYREAHLEPLSMTTAEVQKWLASYQKSYYLAQRLKRKPQILRKLVRLNVRLSQLQDIGGLRVIVPRNSDVDDLCRYLKSRISSQHDVEILKETDYRDKGRDRTGYRALHVILRRSGVTLELQIRSRIQHAWSENIERTSVIYGRHLKEEDGDIKVLRYFQLLSDAFYEVEVGRNPSPSLRLEVDAQRESAERIILEAPRGSLLVSDINERVIRSITAQLPRGTSGINNWILVFDWNTASFVHWSHASRDAAAAMHEYVDHERRFPAEDGFEVVLVGASEPDTLRQTHGHYFGLAKYDDVLESLDVAMESLSKRLGLGLSEREVLLSLHRKHKWGASRVSRDTIRNHYCPQVKHVDEAIDALVSRGLLIESVGISLNQKAKASIEAQL